MTLQAALMFGIKTSITLSILSTGMDLSVQDTTYLLRDRRKLLRSLFAIDIVMPAFAITAAVLFALPAAVKIALVALSLSPPPPEFPHKAMEHGGSQAYVAGLLVAPAIVSLAFVPLAIWLLGAIWNIDTHLTPADVGTILGITVFVPLIAGIAVRQIWPRRAEQFSKPIARIAMALLGVLVLVLLVVGGWRPILAQMHNGAVAIFAAFVLFGIVVGHVLGGSQREDRIALSLATATRHPGIAIAIASVNFPAQKAATAAIFLYLIVNEIVDIPYARWLKRQNSESNASRA